MRQSILDDARLYCIDLNRGVTAAAALDQALECLGRRPEIWTWDWIVDARVTPDDASFEHIATLAKASSLRPIQPVLTMLVPRQLHGPVGPGDGFSVPKAATPGGCKR